MSGRVGLRSLTSLFRQTSTPSSTTSRQILQKSTRHASTTTTIPSPGTVNQSKFQQFLHSEVGPKTVHFWAPIMKWGLVIAGAADFFRPAEALSLTQNAALMTTGALWTRWCFIIKPKNVFLASVNFLVFCVGATQVTRVLLYQQSVKGESIVEEVKDAARQEGRDLKEAVKTVGDKIVK